MDCKEILKEKLRRYRKEDIILSSHAEEQAAFRGISQEEIRGNILNPIRLAYAQKQVALKEGEEKYNCYFGYSKTQCHRYALVINDKCLICTVIKINRRWQREIEKNAKI